METTYILLSSDGPEAFASRADAQAFAREGDTITEAHFHADPPAGYVRDWNGHAPFTYVNGDGLYFCTYPPLHCETGSDVAIYAVGEDGVQEWYTGPDYALAVSVALGDS